MTDAIFLDYGDADLAQDPYPTFERVRALGPVVRDSRSGDWLVTGFEDCARVHANHKTFTSEVPEGTGPGVFGGPVFELMDGPRHDEIRGIWARDFLRAQLERHRPMIETVVDRALDAFVPRVLDGETVDAVTGLTREIPTDVISNLLGIDEDRQGEFSLWSDHMGAVATAMFDKSEAGQAAMLEGVEATRNLNGCIADEVERRRKCPGEDLISTMVQSPVAQTMAENEIVANNTQLVFAGNETTAKWMAHTLVTLARHPDQRAALVADRSLIPRALEEVLRFETVAQLGRRTVRTDDAEVAGVPIPRGDAVACLLGAADRDPNRWDDPNAFDVLRAPKQHFGFGFGLHLCIGIHLARLETQVWLDRLLDRLPEWEVADDITYGTNVVLRGPAAVPISAA
ncbi:MAG: cytochrome [Actinomycetia bacterium]|nr:cytochrome [Actinomycetes bacterium]